MGRVFDEDVFNLCFEELVPWQDIDGHALVLTGSTGLIGRLIAKSIERRNILVNSDIELFLPVRDVVRAQRVVGVRDAAYIPWDAAKGYAPDINRCDFIVHLAGVTASSMMVNDPIGTIDVTLNGTRAMLELAYRHNARMVFSSSMEVYGSGSTLPITETCGGEFDSMNVRSSYPQSKRMAETLIAAYQSQLGLDACCARLAQTIGAGVPDSDSRAIPSFARACLSGEDIKLLTDGSKANTLLCTFDAATALLLLAVRGEGGQAYNVGNEDTFTSIWTIANILAKSYGRGTRVTRVENSPEASKYAVSGAIRLDCSKLIALGWRPRFGLNEMLERLIEDWG